jgi:hypothetical protein
MKIIIQINFLKGKEMIEFSNYEVKIFMYPGLFKVTFPLYNLSFLKSCVHLK